VKGGAATPGGSPWNVRLVGRRRELAELESERRAASGQLRVVLLLGDPGIGKSRLADEFLARNRQRALTLSARAHPLGETSSFGVWAEALETHLRGQDAAHISEVCEGFLDDIAVLVHSAALARGGAPEREPPKLRLLSGLAGVLFKLASRQPLIVVLDDMGLADASSWEALGNLARTLSSAPILIVCVARLARLATHEVGSEVVLGLEQEARLRRIVLAPLDAEAITELAAVVVGEEPPAALSRWLMERSQGNPLFALSLLQGLLDEGVDLSLPDLSTLPQHLADRIAQLLKNLDEPDLQTLELLAVTAERVELSDLLRLRDLPVETLSATLEELVRARWVTEQERGNHLSYEIAHPLVRDAIYARIGGARRRALHRVIARAHLDQGRLGAAAPHYARSASPGDVEAIDALRDAARQAEGRGAYREALAILDALVQLLPAGHARWKDIVDAMAWRAEWVVDHRAGADAVRGIRPLRRMDAVLNDVDAPATRAAVKFRLANFLAWGTGELEEAKSVCGAAYELFVEVGDRANALLSANEMAWIRGLQGDIVGCEDAARQVVEAAEEAGERFALLQALSTLAVATGWLGHHQRARALWERSTELAAAEGKPYRLLFAQVSLAVTHAYLGNTEEAVRLITEARALPAWGESPLVGWECVVRWAVGDFSGALASAHQTTVFPGPPSKRIAFRLSHGVLSAVEADCPDEAEWFLRRSLAAYGGRDWAYYSQYVVYAQAMVDWRNGLVPRALASLRRVSQRLLAMQAMQAVVVVLVEQAALAAEAADAAAGEEAAAGLAVLTYDDGGDPRHAMAQVGLSWASLVSGEPEAATAHARQALDLLCHQRLPFWTSRAHEALAHALRDRDPAAALSAFDAAGRGFASCGAKWRLRRTNDAMRQVGNSGRRQAARVRGSTLTRREREVARLAAQGHTAREIAEHLSITERTVEGHLSNVYAKLDVASKLELVRTAQELKF
jgi:DNA-binding CsgD family transcriptional regulator/tetratricopeptide (TPR) repeat protein